MPELFPEGQILIGGRWRPGSGNRYPTFYPADGHVVAEVTAADRADVEEAVVAAHTAWRNSGWAERLPHERAAVLHRIAGLLRARQEELADLQRLDNGKPIGETRALVASAAGTFQFMAAACETLEQSLTPQRGEYLTLSVEEPLGVVAAITPWNSPIASEAQKVAPALAAGCAVILKPAEVTPLLALALGRICEEAGVPSGIVSVLPGKGSVVGEALVRHRLVRKVAFTGGTEVGRGIARIAADKVMPVSLELGGKSPTIVCADADLDHAVVGVLFGIFSSSGESCIAGSRLFVERPLYRSFVERLTTTAAAIKVGDPADPATQMGPLITEAHLARIEGYVALGRSEGGRLLTGGRRLAGGLFDKGAFYPPTILEGLTNGARLCQEEIFGPVLAVLPFDDDEDLLAQANDSVYGLAAGIWTQDFRRAWSLSRALETGTVWINTYKQFSISTPFGGVKDSGLGREKGREGIRAYTAQKSLYWGLNPKPLPWADAASASASLCASPSTIEEEA